MRKKSLSVLLVLALLFGVCLVGCNEEIATHTIEVVSSNIQHGRVYGDGVFKTGSDITLTAQELNGATFVAWIKNDIEMSIEKTYTFSASAEMEGRYTAVFKADNTTYFKPSGFAIEYKHVLESENFEQYDVAITGITLKLTLLNSNNIQTVYDNTELNIEVLADDQNSDTLLIESNYYMSKLKTYYLDIQIRYTVDGESAVANKTTIIDFTQTIFLLDDQNTEYAQTSVSVANSSIQTLILVAFHGAGVTPPDNIIDWA